jgi:hypothetical protein
MPNYSLEIKNMNKILTNLARLGFISWLVFELLNWQGVLRFALDFTWKGLVMTAGFTWLALEIVSWLLYKKAGRSLSWYVFMIALVSISVDALGDINHWYSGFSWYDQMAHMVGGGTAALAAFSLYWELVKSGKIVMGKKFAGFLAVATAGFLGTFYEMEEYLEDVFTGSHRLGDGPDTANDIMMNTIGAIIMVMVVVLLTRRVHRSNISNEKIIEKT